MKKIIITIMSILLIVNTISALYYSGPMRLEFNGYENQEICQDLYFNTNLNNIVLDDRWVEENQNNGWVSSFNYVTSEDKGIKIRYDLLTNNHIRVCVEAENSGKYLGQLLIKENDECDGICQQEVMSVWLKLSISEIEVFKTTSLNSRWVRFFDLKEGDCWRKRTIHQIINNGRYSTLIWSEGCFN